MRHVLVIFSALLAVGPAHAYIGPGLGAGALAAILGFLFSILLAVLAIVWYPAKRVLRRLRGHPADPTGEASDQDEDTPPPHP